MTRRSVRRLGPEVSGDTAASQRALVLVAEDNADTRIMLCDYLSKLVGL